MHSLDAPNELEKDILVLFDRFLFIKEASIKSLKNIFSNRISDFLEKLNIGLIPFQKTVVSKGYIESLVEELIIEVKNRFWIFNSFCKMPKK